VNLAPPAAGDEEPSVLVEARGITKSFGGAQAVRSATLTLRGGQVHALIGENGAGKSTVIKMLSGAERADAGEILLDGQPISFHSPADAEASRITTVYQELDLIDDLTVGQNVMLGREPRRAGFLRNRELRRQAQEALATAGSTVDIDASPAALSLAQQQRVEIARCLLADARVLILDEPTAALGPREVDDLFDLIRSLSERGVAVLFVSHRLEEVLEISDVVTVMRDGEVVSTAPVADVTEADLIASMTGRVLDLSTVRAESRVSADIAPVLELRRIPLAKGELNLALAPGEIVGVAGLAGSGRSRLLETIIGSPWLGGEIVLDGVSYHHLTPADAVRAGIAYLPEDRKRLGLVLEADAAFNVSLSSLARAHSPWATAAQDARRLREATSRMSLRGNTSSHVARLSGGNQQKVLLARLLASRPRVLLLDEPTRGVDIAAKKEVWDLLEEIADGGTAILMVSSELPEILRLSDRILVLADGQLTAEFPAGTSQELLLEAALPRRERTPSVPDAGPNERQK